MSELIRRPKVFTGADRRRTWSVEKKAAIIAESDGPDTSISAVARRHGLSASQLFMWRRLLRQAGRHGGECPLQFVPAVMSVSRQELASAETGSALREQDGCHGIEVEIAGATVRIAQGVTAAQVAAVIWALKAPLRTIGGGCKRCSGRRRATGSDGFSTSAAAVKLRALRHRNPTSTSP